MQATGARRVIHAAIIANVVIAASKYAVAALTGSAAMLAEAFHTTVDTGNELLLLLGTERSQRLPDPLHPFGYGKELYFWSLLVAIVTFGLGSGFAIYDGVARLATHAPLEPPLWNYIVLGVAGVFEAYSWQISHRELRRHAPREESLWTTVERSKDPSIFTVFLEDTAGLAGVAIAALGIFLSHWLNQPALDPVASIVIGAMLAVVAVVLARESATLLVGESADEEQLGRIRRLIGADPAVEQAGRLFTMQLGPGELLLTANIRFRRDLDLPALEAAIDRIERQVRAAEPMVRHIFLEAESLRVSAGER